MNTLELAPVHEGTAPPGSSGHRILIVDDNRAIHEDFQKVLRSPTRNEALETLESQLFGEPSNRVAQRHFDLSFASQGQQAIELVEQGLARDEHFSVAFVDMRMPPGLDGLETIERMWKIDPHIQTVICTAFSDHGWEDVARRLECFDQVLIIKKPFDRVEVLQAAHNLSQKWELRQLADERLKQLKDTIEGQTAELRSTNAQLAEKVSQLQRMETELRLAQKLEGIGQLAAGVAHEINTPAQFVSDNLSFLSTSLEELIRIMNAYDEHGGPCAEVEQLKDELDLPYLLTEMPVAITQSLEGMQHVARIVQALKQFCHPGSEEMSQVDLNAALETTLAVSRNEWKYVAEQVCEFDPNLPPVPGIPGELNQVFLNLVVNAAQAMQERYTDKQGRLTLRTRQLGETVEIQIADTGGGIPEKIQARVFDPFFTTKAVGKGTGQGLAIAHSVIVQKHGGQLRFESVSGVGTTFYISLPVHARSAEE